MNLNSPPSPFDQDHDHQPHLQYPFAVPNHQQMIPSSSSSSCHFFFDSSQDHHLTTTTTYHHNLYPHLHQEVDNYTYGGGGGSSSTYEIKNKVHEENSGLKLTLWKNVQQEDDDDDHHNNIHVSATKMVSSKNNDNEGGSGSGLKWMSSKMRLMQKMKKNPDRNVGKKNNDEDQKFVLKRQPSCNVEISTDGLSSNSNVYSCSYNSNMISSSSPIRVCSDCNTTKTPLWRSGPKGPKSLCNACGIRQRKARRAMAEAATNGSMVASYQKPLAPAPEPPVTPPAIKIKEEDKEKINNTSTSKNGHAKKRLKISDDTESTTSSNGKKIGFEDFLINLSKKLAFHRVFPEDEKDAAILLMAISSGLVHG